MHHRIIFTLIVLSVMLPGCQGVTHTDLDIPWQYSDVRALDSSDASNPGADVLAVYLRQHSSSLSEKDSQLRLDFLDLSYLPECDVYIAFDTQPGGSIQISPSLATNIDWDILLKVSASLQIQLFDAQLNRLPATHISVYRDPVQDTLTIDFSDKIFQYPASIYKFQIFTTQPGSTMLIDSTQSISSAGVPPQRAETRLAFWNTFPALTPVQTLRRWDGAHTGPQGGRHGLFNLLIAAKNHTIPLILLDLKTPTSLAALDYVGGMTLIQDMLDKELLLLPDPQPVLSYSNPVSLPGEVMDRALAFIQTDERAFNLPSSQAVFSTSAPFVDSEGISRYSTIFQMQFPQPSNDSPYPEFYLSSCAGQAVVPITIFPETDRYYDQTGTDGASISLRRALIDNAIQNTQLNSTDTVFVILGGELPKSTWGILDEAEATFTYFDNHPWIHVVGENDLKLSYGSKSSDCQEKITAAEFNLRTQTIMALVTSPRNIAYSQAIQTLTSLTTPIYPDSAGLLELRKKYLGQVDVLIEVARWVENRSTKSDCEIDIDSDSQPDCILTSDRFFLVLDPQNGGLSDAFFIDRGNLHQIIGPSSLLATGLSSPETWNRSDGAISDPSVISGAFWGEEKPYHIDVGNHTIKFTSLAGTKSYTLSPGGISINITEPTDKPYQMPFLFDPWMRFTPQWANSFTSEFELVGNSSFSWNYPDGSNIVLESNNPLTIISFTDSQAFMQSTENPDIDYPQGHFLPIPLVEAEIPFSSSPLIVNLNIR
jgi:hypothetical protein